MSIHFPILILALTPALPPLPPGGSPALWAPAQKDHPTLLPLFLPSHPCRHTLQLPQGRCSIVSHGVDRAHHKY